MRPEVDASLGFAIEGGRHPVVEQALKRAGQPFIAPTLRPVAGAGAGVGTIWLITGPKHGRQIHLPASERADRALGADGGFVPAARARIGVIDRLFRPASAPPMIWRAARSTFMVEMVETAAILNQAGERALVILDEIGRGIRDLLGLSIAGRDRAPARIQQCRTLFATHYHELTALSAKLPRLFNATVPGQGMARPTWCSCTRCCPARPTALRHSGGEARRSAGTRHRPRQGGAGETRRQDRGATTRALTDDLPLFAVPSRAAPTAAPQRNRAVDRGA